jgi:nucleoside phosphorylase
MSGGGVMIAQNGLVAGASLQRWPRAGLLSALPAPELISFDAPLENRGWRLDDKTPDSVLRAGIRIWYKVIDNSRIEICTGSLGKAGQANAAVETTVFVDRMIPDVVALCGIAGSFDCQKLPKRDVVIAKSITWHGRNKAEDSIPPLTYADGTPCFKYRTHNHRAPPIFTQEIGIEIERLLASYGSSYSAPQLGFQVRYEDIFSWDFVVSGETVVKQILKDSPDSVCVEMEAGGFVSALGRLSILRNRRIQPLVIRGISDDANNKDNNKIDRAIASANAAQIAIRLIEDWFQSPIFWDVTPPGRAGS